MTKNWKRSDDVQWGKKEKKNETPNTKSEVQTIKKEEIKPLSKQRQLYFFYKRKR